MVSHAQLTMDLQARQPFYLEVNGHVINAHPCERLVFDVVSKDNKCLLKTKLLNGDLFEQNITVKQGFRLEYQLGKDKKDNWKWSIMGESPMVLDTAALNSIPSLGAIYAGVRKCDSPMNEDDFEDLKGNCQATHKSEERMQSITQGMSAFCVTVEQVKQLLNLFELEDEKLELLSSIRDKIYNWDERSQLESSFFTERSQVKAKAILQ